MSENDSTAPLRRIQIDMGDRRIYCTQCGHDPLLQADNDRRNNEEIAKLRAENKHLLEELVGMQAWSVKQGSEIQLLREAILAILANPQGCPMCDAGVLRNPNKSHWDDCPYAMAREAIG